MALAAAVLAAASCAQSPPRAAVLDSGRVAAVVVGRSTRDEVFAALGRPGRTERSALGESWVYETGAPAAGHPGLAGATAASGVAGAFVPYVGLIGSGLGLAGAAMDGTAGPAPQAVSLTVTFRSDGIVRECAYASTGAPNGTAGVEPVDCTRPGPPLGPRS